MNALYGLINEWVGRPPEQSRSSNLFARMAGVSTSRGLVREENQDRAVILRYSNVLPNTQDVLLGLVADGIGGLPNGSECATSAIAAFITNLISRPGRDLVADIKSSILKANATVFEFAKGRGGATLAGYLISSRGKAFAFSVGDSKVHCVSQMGVLVQITTDDTIGAQLKAAGHRVDVAPAEHKQLIQFAGAGPGLEPHVYDITSEIFDEGARWLLTSTDGLSMLSRNVVSQILSHSPDARSAVSRLVKVADWLGGIDNSSIVLADVDEVLRGLPSSFGVRFARCIDSCGVLDISTYPQASYESMENSGRGIGLAKGPRGKRKSKKGGPGRTYNQQSAEDVERRPSQEASIEIIDANDIPSTISKKTFLSKGDESVDRNANDEVSQPKLLE